MIIKERLVIYIKNIFKILCCLEEISVEEEREFNKLIDFIYFVIMDICRNDGVNATDIKVIGAGVFSIVLAIGNKVLKKKNQR